MSRSMAASRSITATACFRQASRAAAASSEVTTGGGRSSRTAKNVHPPSSRAASITKRFIGRLSGCQDRE
jgi:hypothetical protein